ncbi:PadR family transcriptional regulator [Pseudonocardia eucalypti]|uniref:PadR family transcriptional regulator n=1 Tax=Pseudonocardia eucalypti TaxID=648755 RepID=A0ABP9QSF3_9PSEU
MLLEAPAHAYRIQQLIKERHKDEVVNVAQRNSVYQAIDRLRRAELITVRDTEREGARPERTVYEITEAGEEAVLAWLRDRLATPAREFPAFPAALAFLPLLSQADVIDRLAERERELAGAVHGKGAQLAGPGLPPRLFLVEGEYQLRMLAAELDWVRELLADLRSGALSWDAEALRAFMAKEAGV